MSSVDMCEHDWPGTGCKDCKAAALDRVAAERDAALAELAALKGGREAVYWQVRNHDDQYGWSQWKFIKPTNSYLGQTVETMLADYRTYIERGYKYELRALYTAPPAQASAWVPEGWKLVPAVATLKIKNAIWNEIARQGSEPEDFEAQTIYCAALAAAPTPGASE